MRSLNRLNVIDATAQQKIEVERVLNLFPSAEMAEHLYLSLEEKKRRSLDEVVRRILHIREKDAKVSRLVSFPRLGHPFALSYDTSKKISTYDLAFIRRLALIVLANPHDITMETGKILGR